MNFTPNWQLKCSREQIWSHKILRSKGRRSRLRRDEIWSKRHVRNSEGRGFKDHSHRPLQQRHTDWQSAVGDHLVFWHIESHHRQTEHWAFLTIWRTPHWLLRQWKSKTTTVWAHTSFITWYNGKHRRQNIPRTEHQTADVQEDGSPMKV